MVVASFLAGWASSRKHLRHRATLGNPISIPTGCETLSFAGNRTISEMALSRRSVQAETTEFAKADLLRRRGGITTALLQDLFVLAVDAPSASDQELSWFKHDALPLYPRDHLFVLKRIVVVPILGA